MSQTDQSQALTKARDVHSLHEQDLKNLDAAITDYSQARKNSINERILFDKYFWMVQLDLSLQNLEEAHKKVMESRIKLYEHIHILLGEPKTE